MLIHVRRFVTALLLGIGLLAVPAVVPVHHVLPSAHATAGTWTLFNDSRTLLLQGSLKTGDTFKVMLFTNASNVTTSSTTCTTGLTNEVGTSNTGYTTGGVTITPSLSGTTSVTWSFGSNPTWTAGSSNLTAKWAVVCDTTSTYGLAFVTLDSGGADVTTTSGQTLTIDSDGSPGPVFTFA